MSDSAVRTMTFYFSERLHDDAQLVGIAHADGGLVMGCVTDHTEDFQVHPSWLPYFGSDLREGKPGDKLRDLYKMGMDAG